MLALLVGRFHAVTAGQARWMSALAGRRDVERIVVAITSADRSGTRRNPLPVEWREAMLRPVLEPTGARYDLVRVADVNDDAAWIPHLAAAIERAVGAAPSPSETQVFTANRDVDGLFTAAGYAVLAHVLTGPTPAELLQRAAAGAPWQDDAAPSTIAVWERNGVPGMLGRLFAQKLVDDDGELGHQRDFDSYGAQMDASLPAKLADLVPWVLPGRIVDKGCGTGRLLVELSRRFPASAFVGVDLSREFLRRCDENTYASEEVELVCGDAADVAVPAATASTVILSSIVHEIWSYNGYSEAAVRKALASAFTDLAPGGHLLVRDGVSPGRATWRLRFLDEATNAVFERFAHEFKHGRGAPHTRLGPATVELSAHFANEFLSKKDYLKNWHIEVHEEFGVFTVGEWREALAAAGFEVVTVTSSTNPWIVENRYEGHVEVQDAHGRRIDWPATNVLAVGRKP